MSRELIISGVLSLIALILFFKSGAVQNSILEEQKILASVERDGIVLSDLKNRWDNKKAKKKLERFLKRYKPKVKRRGDILTFSFKELNKRDFEKLSKKVLQSTVKLKLFEVDRLDKFTVNFKLEVMR